MNFKIKKPLDIFIICLLVIGVPLFLFPVNLFPGEIVSMINETEHITKAPLSLSYFIGLGYDAQDMASVKDFYLTARGYALAGCLLVGIPFLIAYRVSTKNKMKAKL